MSFDEKYDWYQKTLAETFNKIDKEQVRKAFECLKKAITHHNNIFLCGNGGSASLANHFATDFMKGVSTDTYARPKVISLCGNESLITAIGNDFGYEEIFRTQMLNLFDCNDVLICISSSGNSENIQEAIDYANTIGRTIGISGFKETNYTNRSSQIPIHIPCENYGICEDLTSNIFHILSQSLRLEFAKKEVDASCFTF